jgi:protoporphyrinogen oxidase
MGESSWKSIWEPLLIGKFGQYADSVSASWFWARIKKRTPLLGYPEGGFTTLARKIASAIEKMGGKIYYRQQISSFQKELAGFDQVISTVPRRNVPFLGTINLVLRFKKPFLPNNIYWLNIATPKFPFLSVIEHTNLISSKNYGGEHLVYVGQYLSPNQTEFSLTDKELLQKYHGDLKKINPGYQSLLSGFDVFKDPYTQPVFPLNYSRTASFLNKTVGGIFQASIEQVYPWDRGTNYAVALGRGVAETIIKKNEK